MLSDKIKKVGTVSQDIIIDTVIEYLLEAAEKIKDIIKDNYYEISMKTVVENSQSNLSLYKNLFDSRVDNFKYVIQSDKGKVKLVTPSMDNFNFMDLEVLQSIFEGIAGRYVELSESEYNIINRMDNKVSPKKKTYLLRETQEIVDIEDSIFKRKLTRFPFSNKPPLHIEIFGIASEYVKSNIDVWLADAVRIGKNRLKNTFNGVA